MSLSGATVRAALAAVGAVGSQIRSFDELAAGAEDALRQAPAGLTPAGAAAFLATCAVESAWFRTTTEYGSGQRYAPFIGRTFVQLTWEGNYRDFGAWCHRRGLVDDPAVFVKNPASLSDFRWAWLGAVFFFEANGIWRWANAGNFMAVSQAVNGGNGRVGTAFVPNHWRERQAMYLVFRAVGDALVPAPSAPQARVVAPKSQQEDEMYVIHQPDKSKQEFWYAILSGPIFVGLGPSEIGSAKEAIKAGAAQQWVERVTWDELDRRSKRLCRLKADGSPED